MLRLLRKDVAPPDEFRFTHPENGHRSTGVDWWNFMERVRLHRSANDLPSVSEAEVEDQLCRQLGPEWCAYEESSGEGRESRAFVSTRLTLNDVVDGMKVFAAWMLQLFKTVPQEEAERRANICARCYLNVNVEGCGACLQLETIIGSFAKNTTVDDRLKVCAVCRCVNRAQVWAPLEVLTPHMQPEVQAQYPEFCWQKVGGENYLPNELAEAAA